MNEIKKKQYKNIFEAEEEEQQRKKLEPSLSCLLVEALLQSFWAIWAQPFLECSPLVVFQETRLSVGGFELGK
jgi:hypothetical protein